MFKVRLPGDHLNEKWLFTWLSLVMPLVLSSFLLPFSLEMSWMISMTELSQFLEIFLTYSFTCSAWPLMNIVLMFSSRSHLLQEFGARI